MRWLKRSRRSGIFLLSLLSCLLLLQSPAATAPSRGSLGKASSLNILHGYCRRGGACPSRDWNLYRLQRREERPRVSPELTLPYGSSHVVGLSSEPCQGSLKRELSPEATEGVKKQDNKDKRKIPLRRDLFNHLIRRARGIEFF